MADPISLQQGFQQIAQQSMQETSSAVQIKPNEEDINKFQDQMKLLEANNKESFQVNNEINANNVEPNQKTIGDSLLEGLDKLRTSYDERIDNINQLVNKPSDEVMDTQELMKMHFELMQLNIQQDLTSKVADKSSQGLQTLFKNQ